MKDSRESLESSRPKKDVDDCVDFCLNRLFDDNVHSAEDEVVKGLTFEELIGALLLAKDSLEEGR